MPEIVPFPYITNPIVFRASAALPAAGAWVSVGAAQPIVAVPQHATVTLYASYTRGAAGGAFDFRLVVSPYSATVAGVENWFVQSEYSAAVLAAGADSQSRLQREYLTYQSQAAAIENVVYGPVDLGAGVERMYVDCRESGVVGTPGTLHIVGIVFNYQT